jgi:excinuclease UvrABC helicase subunit UvrB
MEKAIELLNNRNFTYMEKRAKLGAMVKGEIVEKVKEYNNMHNITPKEIKNRINERIQELKDRRGEKE